MKTNDISNSALTTIDLATLDHVSGGYKVWDILGKAFEGGLGGFVGTGGNWKTRTLGGLGGAWAAGSAEYDREASDAAARKADRLKKIAAAG